MAEGRDHRVHLLSDHESNNPALQNPCSEVVAEHGIRGELPPVSKGDGSGIDRFDQELAEARRLGLFVMANYHHRNWIPGADRPGSFVDDGGDFEAWRQALSEDDWEPAKIAKYVNLVDPRLERIHKRWLSLMLDRVNPYTGTRYAEEEAIVIQELGNEQRVVPAIYKLGAKGVFGYRYHNGVDQWLLAFKGGSRLQIEPTAEYALEAPAGASGDAPSGAVAAGDEILWDWPNGRLIVDTPTAKFLIGRTANHTFRDGIAFSGFDHPWAAVGLVSDDGKPLADGSKRALRRQPLKGRASRPAKKVSMWSSIAAICCWTYPRKLPSATRARVLSEWKRL